LYDEIDSGVLMVIKVLQTPSCERFES